MQGNNFNMKIKSKHCMKRKKGRLRSNRMISVYSNVSKFFKTQHTIRCTVLQTDVVWMRAVTYG